MLDIVPPWQCRLRRPVLDHRPRTTKMPASAESVSDLSTVRSHRQGRPGDRRQRRDRVRHREGVAEAGADVAIWGTNAEKNATAQAELAKTGRKVVALQCDVGDEAAVDAAFARTLEAMGRVDGCFANAGIGGGGAASFLEMTGEQWRRVLRVNLDGAFYTFRAAARHMVERGGDGVLVGTASLAAIEGSPRSEHYAATKGGMISMVRALAVEFARHNVRAHAILPGWIETDMTQRLRRTRRSTAGHAEDSDAALGPWRGFRRYRGVSDEPASRYHTGDTFVIDGGYSLF